jgi:hypothetical protein
MLIGVLILPYIFMDQSESFSNAVQENLQNYAPFDSSPNIQNIVIEQPKINLNENEKVENLKALEEIKKKEEINNKKIETEKIAEQINKKTFTIDEVKNLLNVVNNKNKLIENYGSMYTGEVNKEYNEDSTFTNQLLKPLGQNGNGLTNAWDHDYILLNTDKWGPALNPPPVCKTEKTCPVCPNLTTGYPLMVRDFDSSRRVTPPINADIPLMNKTDSVEPTNATSPDSGNNALVALIKSVPKENRPALISTIAKQMNTNVDFINTVMKNDELSKTSSMSS